MDYVLLSGQHAWQVHTAATRLNIALHIFDTAA
jgi:hypothetical protein